MMIRSFLALTISFSALSAHAYWWGSYTTKGVLTVTKPFTIKRTVKYKADKLDQQVITLAPGAYRISVLSSNYNESAGCLPMIYCSEGKDVSYLEIAFLKKNGEVARAIEFKADSENLKGKGPFYDAKKMRQSFNIFEKSSSSTKSVNYHTVNDEYCEVDEYSVSGGGGGLFYGYGDRTISAIGVKTTHKHDDVTTTVVNMKFTDAATNEVIASYAGSRDDTQSDILDSEGKCRLNRNHDNN